MQPVGGEIPARLQEIEPLIASVKSAGCPVVIGAFEHRKPAHTAIHERRGAGRA